MIDVVVPIYNAYEATKLCIEKLAEFDDLAENVYLINDASTDERVLPLLKSEAKKNSWILLENKENQGFVKTANRGLKK